MAPKRYAPNDPREWISRAKSSLAHAKAISPEVVLEDLCFDAQQAAEKAIKAVFIHRGEAFPYSHDLDRLLRLLEQNGLRIAKYLDTARELTRFAVITRYPGLAAAVTQAKFLRAVRIADTVVRWAERQIK
jgi:HEPN domain-containing protein